MGSLAMKEPRRFWSSDDAFPKRELYLNVSNNISDDDEEEVFEFKFHNSQKMPNDNNKWFKVKDVLLFQSASELMFSKVKDGWQDTEVQLVSQLWEVICRQKFISYFSVEDASMDEVLDIFVRVNSAGTELSKTDLIFSTLTAKWPEGRESIDALIKNINRTTRKFSFNNDFVMRTMLYLTDLPINLKVESFKDNVNKIQNNYKKIENAIKLMVDLIERNGFSNENISSYNALIPIVYL